jgi:hypothetical protein
MRLNACVFNKIAFGPWLARGTNLMPNAKTVENKGFASKNFALRNFLSIDVLMSPDGERG